MIDVVGVQAAAIKATGSVPAWTCLTTALTQPVLADEPVKKHIGVSFLHSTTLPCLTLTVSV